MADNNIAWPSERVVRFRKIDTTAVLQMVSSCRKVLENMTTVQFVAYQRYTPTQDSADWLAELPRLDSSSDPQQVAAIFSQAMTNLRQTLTALGLEVGGDRYPSSLWKRMFESTYETPLQYFNLFDGLEETLRTLPDYEQQEEMYESASEPDEEMNDMASEQDEEQDSGRLYAMRAIQNQQLDSLCFTDTERLGAEHRRQLMALTAGDNTSLTLYQVLKARRQGLVTGMVGIIRLDSGKGYNFIAKYTADAAYGVPAPCDLADKHCFGPVWHVPMRIFRMPATIPYRRSLRSTPMAFGPTTLTAALNELKAVYDM